MRGTGAPSRSEPVAQADDRLGLAPHVDGPPSTKNPVAEAVGLPDAPVLTTRAARVIGLAFLELNCDRRNIGITSPVREDAFLLVLQLKTCPDFDLYADGKSIPPRDFDAGAVAIFDLRCRLCDADQRRPHRPRPRPADHRGAGRFPAAADLPG